MVTEFRPRSDKRIEQINLMAKKAFPPNRVTLSRELHGGMRVAGSSRNWNERGKVQFSPWKSNKWSPVVIVIWALLSALLA